MPPHPCANDRLIVALDFSSASAALTHVQRLDGRCRWFKVGLELYFAAGPTIVEQLCDSGYQVFLDLKLHDIPNTVAAAIRSLSSSGASLLSLHAAGGSAMLAAAAEAASTAQASSPGAPRLVAVTVLTSMDTAQLSGIGVSSTAPEQVLRLARLASAAGIPDLVCSAQELPLLRSALGPGARLVVPGIRPIGSPTDDQHRLATPAQALAAGASMLVVGRPITRSADPAAAVDAILAEMSAVTL